MRLEIENLKKNSPQNQEAGTHSNNKQNFVNAFNNGDDDDETDLDEEDSEEGEDDEGDETDSNDEDSENQDLSESIQTFKGIRYACDECDANYGNKYGLKDHKDVQHLECDLDDYVAVPINGKYACNKCSMTLREPRTLDLHRIRMHNLKSTKTINSLKKRSNAAKNPNTKQCKICGLFVVDVPRHLQSCAKMIDEKNKKVDNIMNSSACRTFYEFSREEKFDFLNKSNIFEFLFSILKDIKENMTGSVLDLALYYYFLIILGLRPGASGKNKGFLSIKLKNITVLKNFNNIIKLNFKCKTGYRIKHILNIKDSFVAQKIALKLNSPGNQKDYFFLNNLKGQYKRMLKVTSYCVAYNKMFIPKMFRFFRGTIEFHKTLKYLEELMQQDPTKKQALIENLKKLLVSRDKAGIMPTIVSHVKSLLCHEKFGSSFHYVDDRIFYKFLRVLVGEDAAKKLYFHSYKNIIATKTNDLNESNFFKLENYWAFNEFEYNYASFDLQNFYSFSEERMIKSYNNLNNIFVRF